MLSFKDLKTLDSPIDIPYVFVVCQRNAGKYIKRCLNSIISQSLENWGLVLFDDNSDDNTVKIIEEYLPKINKKVLVKNDKSYGKLRNFFYGIRFCCSNPETVIIDLDGDDWLSHKDVLKRIDEEYRKGAEQTIGSCEFYPKDLTPTRVGLDDPRAFKSDSNNWLHPRTFKKGLFDLIGIEVFTSENKWHPRSTDWSYVPFLMEMSKKTVVIEEVLYHYNREGSSHFLSNGCSQEDFRKQENMKRFIIDRIPKFPKLEELK